MGLFRTAGKVAVASSVHGRVSRRQQGKWAQQDAAAAAPAPAAVAVQPPAVAAEQVVAPASNPGEMIELLTKLGELKAAGVLTDAEFEQQKARLLAA